MEDAAVWDIQLFNNEMKEMNIQPITTVSKKEIDISTFSAGLYYVILTKNGQKITKLVVKE
jgi:hypothetical protein